MSGRRFAPNLRLEARILAVAGFLLLVLLVLGATPIALFLRDRGPSARLGQTDALLTTSNQVLSLMVDQETGQRGYVITVDERFLEPYTTDRAALATLWPVAAAQAAVVGGAAPALLAATKASAERWQSESREPELTLTRAGDRGAATTAVASGAGKALFDRFRGDHEALVAETERKRRAQVQDQQQITRLINRSLVAMALLGLLAFAALAYLGVVSQRSRLDAARRGVRRNCRGRTATDSGAGGCLDRAYRRRTGCARGSGAHLRAGSQADRR